LSQFSRRARWLNQIFRASKAPQVSDPSVVSNDVSLVQPYDGSGWGFMNTGQMMINIQNSPASAQDTTDIVTMDEFTFGRILGVGVIIAAGVAPTSIKLYLRNLDNNFATAIGRLWDKPMLPTPMRNPLQIQSPILPPGLTLQGHHDGGDAATLIQYTACVIQVPVGTVFYV